MDRKEYGKLLRDPRWKVRRLEILERDNNTCSTCGSNENLQVHHKFYEEKSPWEYSDDELITMCIDCHKKQHRNKGNAYKNYISKYNMVSDYESDIIGAVNTKSSIEVNSSMKIISAINDSISTDDELILDSINNIIGDIVSFSEIQNSGRAKVNVKISGDIEATIYVNVYFKKPEKVVIKSTVRKR